MTAAEARAEAAAIYGATCPEYHEPLAEKPPVTPPLLLRFIDRIDMTSPGSCWVWTSTFEGKGITGQPRLSTGKRTKVMARRFAAETWLTNAPIPKRSIVKVKCGNAKCVNPAHIYVLRYSPPNKGKSTLVDAQSDLHRDIIDLYRDGGTPNSISIRLGVAWGTVRRHIRAHELAGPVNPVLSPNETRERIETALARTGSISGAMRVTGLSYEEVQRVYRAMEAA